MGVARLVFLLSLAATYACAQSGASAAEWFAKGMEYRRLGRHEQARQSLRQAWDLGYHDPLLLYALIEEDHALGDKEHGLADFQLMAHEYPNSAWLHVLLGNAAFEKEKDQQARAEYQQALALDSKLPVVNFRLGYLAFQAGNDDAAARYFRAEIANDPANSDAHLFLGETVRRMGKGADALPFFRRALELDPGSHLAYVSLATGLIEAKKFAEAAEILQRAEKRFPTDPSFPSQLARVYELLDRKQEAEQAAARARSLTALKRKKEELSSQP